jgi:hypothetical protein
LTHSFTLHPQDIAELARLKILGGKLKKKSAAPKDPPSAVLSAMQQARQDSLAAGAIEAALAAAALDSGPGSAGAALSPAAGALTPGALGAAAGAGGWGVGPLPGTPVRRVSGQQLAGAAAAPPAAAQALAHLASLRGAFTGLPYEDDDDAADIASVGCHCCGPTQALPPRGHPLLFLAPHGAAAAAGAFA